MYCTKCGAKLRDGAKFCHVCGKPVARSGNQASADEKEKAQADKVDEKSGRREKIIAALRDSDINASAAPGEVSCKLDAAQSAFMKLLKKGLLCILMLVGFTFSSQAESIFRGLKFDGKDDPEKGITLTVTGFDNSNDVQVNGAFLNGYTKTGNVINFHIVFEPRYSNTNPRKSDTPYKQELLLYVDAWSRKAQAWGGEDKCKILVIDKKIYTSENGPIVVDGSFNVDDYTTINGYPTTQFSIHCEAATKEYDHFKAIYPESYSDPFSSIGTCSCVCNIYLPEDSAAVSSQDAESALDTEGIDGIVSIDSEADEEAGENGWVVPAAVVGGLAVGGLALRGRRKKKAAATKGKKEPAKKEKNKTEDKKDEDDDEEKATYEMRIRKDFGDTLTPGDAPQKVFARIVRIAADGKTSTDRALTAKINISGDGYLHVSKCGFESDYAYALVEAPEIDELPSEAVLNFRLAGAGASFTNRMHFKIAGRQIIFAQDNLTLPAGYDKVVKLPFYVSGMDDSADVSVKLSGDAYAVSLEKGEYAGLWYAILEERKKTVGEPGKYIPYSLNVTARAASGGPELVGSLPIYRFNMGLVFNTEPFLGCYLEEYDVAKHRKELVVEGPTKKYAPAHTKFSFSILSWNEESHKIVRLLPDPESITLKTVPLDKKADAESTDYLSKETNGMSDQDLIDKLGIDFAVTNVLDDNSASGILYPCGVLDAPARRKVNLVLEMKAGPQNTQYKAEQTIWLTSQPLRQGGVDATLQAGKEDESIIDNLNHIISYIVNHNLVRNLFPVMKMAEMMLDGYDIRFGFDPSQVYTVQSTFVSFLRGETLGANADPEKVPELGLMAELMQAMAVTGEQAEMWLDAHGGFATRLGLGLLSFGWSETALSAMKISRDMINVVTREKEPGGALEAFCVGVKAVAIDFATEKVWGALGQESMKTLGNFRPDIAEGVTKVAGEVGGKAKKALGVLGEDVSLANIKEACTEIFGRKTANQLKGVKNANAVAKASAEVTISKSRSLDDWTPEELAEDAAFREQNIAAIKKVKELEHAYHENFMWKSAETEAAFKEAVYAIQTDKLAQKQLALYNGTYAYNLRSKYYQKLTADYASVDRLTKQKVAAKLGVDEDDVEIFCASNSDSRKLFNGEAITRDRDVTIRVKGKPTKNNPNPLGDDVPQDVAESAYNSSFEEVTGYDAVLADQAVVQVGSKERIGAGVDDLERSFKSGRFGETFDDLDGVATAVEHKPKEWFDKAKKLRAQGEIGLAQEKEEEGIRQMYKLWTNSVDPRSAARGSASLITASEREMFQVLGHIEVIYQGPHSLSVTATKKILRTKYGMSLDEAATRLKEIVLRVEQ